MSVEPFIFSLRAHVEDTDFAGVVYHANYLKYFERARSEWAEHTGWGSDWQIANQFFFPVRSVTMDFFKPARLHEKLEVVSYIRSTKSASFVCDQHLRRAGGDATILCRALIKIACVDASFRPRALPDLVLNVLHELIMEN